MVASVFLCKWCNHRELYLLHYGGNGTGQGPICYGKRDSNANNKRNKQVLGNKQINQSYSDKGAFKIGESGLEEIHQEIRRRDTLDQVEGGEEEEDDRDSDGNTTDESE